MSLRDRPVVSKVKFILLVISLIFAASYWSRLHAQTGEIQAVEKVPVQMENMQSDDAGNRITVQQQGAVSREVESSREQESPVSADRADTVPVESGESAAGPAGESGSAGESREIENTGAGNIIAVSGADTREINTISQVDAAEQTAEITVGENRSADGQLNTGQNNSVQAGKESPVSGEQSGQKAPMENLKVTVNPSTLYITPGSTCDLSQVKIEARVGDENKAVTIDSWTASTGSVNLNTYIPPSPDFKGTVTLVGTYRYDGGQGNVQLEIKVRKLYMEERLIVLYIAVILAAMILLSIRSATAGKNYFIRRIGGLNAIDEAIGRSTEMGKPVLYLTGLSDMSSISTIASISILSYVARKTAEYQTPLLVPCCRSLVMNTAREVVKESYIEAGKLDAYKPENIKYITDDQFGFVSGVDGIMLRERPAANFYLGHFMAESLIYAETGNSIGAIQIAGTSEFSQIPFFVAACDYCLIGEELFAASAYLSRKPKDVGTLRGQDIAKLTIIIILIIGVLFETVSAVSPELAPSLGMFKAIFQTR